TLIAGHQNGPRQIAVDDDAIYWLNDGTRGEGKAGIMQAQKRGGDVKALVEGDGIFAFAIASTTLYFLAPRAGKLSKVPKSGGEPRALVETSGIRRGLALDEDTVYWPENEGIFRIPKAGGKPQQIVKEIISPDYLPIDESNAYWYSSLSGIVMKA